MTETIEAREINGLPGASEAYRSAREKLRIAEVALRDQIEAVAALRRELPPGPKARDYEFFEGEKRVRLSELFSAGKPHLFIYHLMYWAKDDEFCPMCSMWVDGLDALSRHVEQRANIAVATRAPVDKLQAWARRRGWQHVRLLSDDGPALARDTGAEDKDGEPIETVLVFTKDGDGVRQTYQSHAYAFDEMRMIDLLCPTWHVLDLLPDGRDDWRPTNDYIR